MANCDEKGESSTCLVFNSYFFHVSKNFLVANRNKRQIMSRNSTDFALCYILIGQLDVPWADSRLGPENARTIR